MKIPTILSSYCHLCQGKCDGYLCERCCALLPQINENTCSYCDLPLPSGLSSPNKPLCGQCLTEKHYFDLNISPYCYQFPLDTLLLKLKSNHEYLWGPYLGNALAKRIQSRTPACLPEVITAVPLHWKRYLSRGYNQSALIGQYLSRSLGISYKELLKKTHKSKTQRQLKKGERQRNLRNSFTYTAKTVFEHVAVVDDVFTTGATANEVARTLKLAGTQRVDIWTLARTPSPTQGDQ